MWGYFQGVNLSQNSVKLPEPDAATCSKEFVKVTRFEVDLTPPAAGAVAVGTNVETHNFDALSMSQERELFVIRGNGVPGPFHDFPDIGQLQIQVP